MFLFGLCLGVLFAGYGGAKIEKSLTDRWWQQHQNQVLECDEPSHPNMKHEPIPPESISQIRQGDCTRISLDDQEFYGKTDGIIVYGDNIAAECHYKIVAVPNKHRPVWHKATERECNAEFTRELKAMNDSGMYGDPPISLGFAELSLGTHSGKSMNPCGYTDGKSFRPIYTIIENGKEREVTKEEWQVQP